MTKLRGLILALTVMVLLVAPTQADPGDANLYVLFEKPATLRGWEWRAVLVRLYRVLNRYMIQNEEGDWVESLPANVQPNNRLHYRLSTDRTKVIIEAKFVREDLNIENAQRLALYLRNALNTANENPPILSYDEDGNPVYDTARSYTVTQVQNAMRNNITIAGGVNATWEESHTLTLAYLAANAAGWGEIVE